MSSAVRAVKRLPSLRPTQRAVHVARRPASDRAAQVHLPQGPLHTTSFPSYPVGANPQLRSIGDRALGIRSQCRGGPWLFCPEAGKEAE